MTSKWTNGEVGWSDGDVLYGADLDDTFEGLIQRDASAEDTAEESHTGDTNWTTKKTIDWTAPDNEDIVLGVMLKCDIKGTAGGTAGVQIEMTSMGGSTSGGISATSNIAEAGVSLESYTTVYLGGRLIDADGTTTVNPLTGRIINAQMNDLRFTIKIQINDAGKTAYIDNVTAYVYYISGAAIKRNATSGNFGSWA